jgi:acetyl esterase/lipase
VYQLVHKGRRGKIMKYKRISGILMIAAGMIGLATQPLFAKTREFPTAATAVQPDHYPDRVTHFPGGVTSLADVVYSVIPGYRPMIIDIYMPPKSNAPKPLVMYIHGGGWMNGDTRHAGATDDFPKVLAALAAEGFVVASLEYRLANEIPYPAQLQDARTAIRFLKMNANKYGIDSSRVGVWGGSAGGHLTALAATTCGVASFEAPLARGATAPAAGSECVQAAVTWYGVFDFYALSARPGGDGAASKLLACKGPCEKVALDQASAITFVNAKTPPFLLIHGTEDKTVPVSQSHDFEAKMKAGGASVQAIYIPGVDHSFIGKTVTETHAATNQALNATFDYFHAQLDKKGK